MLQRRPVAGECRTSSPAPTKSWPSGCHKAADWRWSVWVISGTLLLQSRNTQHLSSPDSDSDRSGAVAEGLRSSLTGDQLTCGFDADPPLPWNLSSTPQTLQPSRKSENRRTETKHFPEHNIKHLNRSQRRRILISHLHDKNVWVCTSSERIFLSEDFDAATLLHFHSFPDYSHACKKVKKLQLQNKHWTLFRRKDPFFKTFWWFLR